MNKVFSSVSGAVSASIIGLALLLPSVAQARCKTLGDVWIEGDCSPQSRHCERHVASKWNTRTPDSRPELVVDVYRRVYRNGNGSGSQVWVWDHVYMRRC